MFHKEEQTRNIGVPTHQQNEFAMRRLMLSDEFWSKLEKILLQEAIYNKRNLRMTVEGILYRAAHGETYPRRWAAGIPSTKDSMRGR